LQKPPYFHLAYLAAASRSLSSGYLSAGLLILFLGCILSFKLTKRKNETKKVLTRTAIVLRKDNSTLRKLGLLCFIIGSAIMFLSFKYGEIRYARPLRMTKIRMITLSHLISMHLEEGEPIPENMTSLSKEWQLSASGIHDGWSNQMQLKKIYENEATKYVITSAGKDGVFDTEDDIKSNSISYQKEDSEKTVNL